MNLLLLLAGLLLLMWLSVCMARKIKVPAWLKAVRVLFLFIAVLSGLYYGWFRIQRAKADADHARATATELVTVMDRYEADKVPRASALSDFSGVGGTQRRKLRPEPA